MEKEDKVTWGQLQHPESGTCFYCTVLSHLLGQFVFQGNNNKYQGVKNYLSGS